MCLRLCQRQTQQQMCHQVNSSQQNNAYEDICDYKRKQKKKKVRTGHEMW